jgi:hypothetical protein
MEEGMFHRKLAHIDVERQLAIRIMIRTSPAGAIFLEHNQDASSRPGVSMYVIDWPGGL